VLFVISERCGPTGGDNYFRPSEMFEPSPQGSGVKRKKPFQPIHQRSSHGFLR